MLGERGGAAGAAVLRFVEFVQVAVFPRFFEGPPDALNVSICECDVGVVPVPERAAQPFKLVVHVADFTLGITAAFFDKFVHAEFEDGLLILNAELLFDQNFNG